jgi:hypothetical protein
MFCACCLVLYWVWVWVLCYDRRSVGQSVLEQSPHPGPVTRYLLVFDNYSSVFWSALSDERTVCHVLGSVDSNKSIVRIYKYLHFTCFTLKECIYNIYKASVSPDQVQQIKCTFSNRSSLYSRRTDNTENKLRDNWYCWSVTSLHQHGSVFIEPLRRSWLHNLVVPLLRAHIARSSSSRCLAMCWHIRVSILQELRHVSSRSCLSVVSATPPEA